MNDLDNRFAYHPPKSEQTVRDHEEVRSKAHIFAIWLDAILPAGREKSTAITKVEEAMFWANAAIARNNKQEF